MDNLYAILPKITEQIYIDFGDHGQLIEDGDWSQDAVDFATLVGGHLADRIEELGHALDAAKSQIIADNKRIAELEAQKIAAYNEVEIQALKVKELEAIALNSGRIVMADERVRELEAILNDLMMAIEEIHDKEHYSHKIVDGDYCRMKLIQVLEDHGIEHGLTAAPGTLGI